MTPSDSSESTTRLFDGRYCLAHGSILGASIATALLLLVRLMIYSGSDSSLLWNSDETGLFSEEEIWRLLRLAGKLAGF